MHITLDITKSPSSNFEFKCCRKAKNQPKKLFTGTNPFVDLHLDFPVRFDKYVAGNTPFLMACDDLADSADSDSDITYQKLVFHTQRLEQLNYYHDKADEIKAIIRLYNGKNKQLFKRRVGQFLQQDQGNSLKPEDINASLYRFISFVFLPFVHFGEVKSLVKEFSQLVTSLSTKPLNNFLENLVSSNFLSNLQKDCLKIYPEIYSAEMPMRPVLFLDLTEKYEKAKMAARISTKEFQSYKDLYKDIAEVFARQLTILAGINNIIHRDNSNSFKIIDGGALSSLEKFTSKVLSDKFKYLDDCWYPLDKEVVDAGMRNAIAHNNVQYNEISQEITYYPNGGNLQQTTGHTIYFLDFMRMILILFREMHNLHHLIKCLFYYEYLIRNKTETSSSTHQ